MIPTVVLVWAGLIALSFAVFRLLGNRNLRRSA
jgi:hypothetical protein